MNHIFPSIVTVVAIAAVFIGLPLLILWFMDKRGILGAVIRKIFGAAALLMGLILIGWIIYNLFAPTKEFREAYKTSFQLALPGLLVWYGWRWLTGPKSYPQDEMKNTTPSGSINTDESNAEQGVAPYGAQGAPPVNADVGIRIMGYRT